MLACGLLVMITPIIYGKVIANGVVNDDMSLLLWLVFFLFLSKFSMAFFNYIQKLLLTRIEMRMVYHLESAIMDKMLSLPLSFFARFKSGDLANRASSLSNLITTLNSTMILSLSSLIYGMFSLIVMGVISWKLTLIVLILSLLMLFIFYIGARLEYPLAKKNLDLKGENMGFTQQSLQAVDKIKVFNRRATVVNHFAKIFSQMQHKRLQIFYIGFAMQLSTIFVRRSTIILVLIAIILYEKQPFGVESYIIFMAALTLFFQHYSNVAGNIRLIVQVFAHLYRVKPILSESSERTSSAQKNIIISGGIELKHISLSYANMSRPLLDDISLRIYAGAFIGIVGLSGAGKSSLINLILGLQKPNAGQIFYDNTDLSQLSLKNLYRQIGTVLQTDSLLTGTIRQNISCDDNTIADEIIWQLLDTVGLKEDILALPMALETLVSADRNTFSGGQIQRILIARALRYQPKILILDEATSALDNNSQATISAHINQMNITRIVIAHRLSTIKKADIIYFLHEGKFIESGSFQDLNKEGTLFQQLFTMPA
ncbi:MAG: ATP-binding cassette domain-containing protein [Francisellaceae bacterium]